MARMKGNRGTKGFQHPPIDLPVAFGDGRPPAGRRPIRWWPAIVAALVLAVIVAGGVALALRNSDDVATADPTEPATPVAAVTLTPTPAAPTPPTATNTVAAPTSTPAPSRTASATATQPATVAPTAPPTVAATPAPTGPPLVRTRYVVQPGDGCEIIRMKFKFANADFAEFPVAMGALSGRSAANRCVMNTGDVFCIPTQSDLGRLNALTKDEACLAGP